MREYVRHFSAWMFFLLRNNVNLCETDISGFPLAFLFSAKSDHYFGVYWVEVLIVICECNYKTIYRFHNDITKEKTLNV